MAIEASTVGCQLEVIHPRHRCAAGVLSKDNVPALGSAQTLTGEVLSPSARPLEWDMFQSKKK
ncbi:hypothetical protein PGT21_000835 [Puccinia graminis f. sp. tritici]|uniref:Uncharacterized protein n=1 Tax=Puccinia graminis f. sp. tritici TaxID=56615 RepID=A0A5B0MI46_PUCGR|nr:hypothetical protein PGT21_000835 [Puccinia graminis f. sp. tritici]